jgi:hypothetical protein
MIQVKWVAAILLIYIIGFILGTTYETVTFQNQYGGYTQESELSYLTSFGQTNTSSTSGTYNIINIPTTAPNFFNVLMNAAFLRFTFFQGQGYDMVYYIIILPFVALPGVLAILYALYLLVIALFPF